MPTASTPFADRWEAELKSIVLMMVFEEAAFMRDALIASLTEGKFEYRERGDILTLPVQGVDPDDQVWGRARIGKEDTVGYVIGVELLKATEKAPSLAPKNAIPLLSFFTLVSANLTTNQEVEPVIATGNFQLPRETWELAMRAPLTLPPELSRLPGDPELTGVELRMSEASSVLKLINLDIHPALKQLKMSLTVAVAFLPISDLPNRALAVLQEHLPLLARKADATGSKSPTVPNDA